MIKDMVVNLVGRGPQDFAADYALSVAAMFGAHLVGTAFVYDAVIPDGALGAIPVDLIELQQEENSKIANTAVERFNARAKAAGVSAETRTLDATLGGAAARARRVRGSPDRSGTVRIGTPGRPRAIHSEAGAQA
jgi:hypothetical protein